MSLRIHLASAPPQRETCHASTSATSLWDQYFVRSPIQGLGELMIYGIETHKLMVAVPIGRFEKEYARVNRAKQPADESHVILNFKSR